MKRILLSITLFAACALQAAEPSLLPATTRWVFHLECQRILDSDFGPFIKQITARPESAAGIAALQLNTGINVLTDLQSVTFFGEDANEDNFVLAIHGKFDRARLTAMIRGGIKHQEQEYAGRVIHQWEDKGRMNQGCFANDTLVLVGKSDTAIKNSIDALDAKTPASALAGELNTPATLGFGAVRDLTKLRGADPKAAILQQVDTLQLGVVLREKLIVASLEGQAASEPAAKHVKSIVEGLRALVLLNKKQDANAAAIADKLNIQSDGAHLRLSVELPVGTITAWLQDRINENAGRGASASPAVLATPQDKN